MLDKEKNSSKSGTAGNDEFVKHDKTTIAMAVYKTFNEIVWPAYLKNKKYWEDNNGVLGENVEDAMAAINDEYKTLSKPSEKTAFLDRFRREATGAEVLKKLHDLVNNL